MFDSYGEALNSYIEKTWGYGGKKKLAKMLVEDPENDSQVHNKGVEISRWTNKDPEKRKTPIPRTIKDINNKLNICIIQDERGKWKISRTKGEEYMEKYTRGVDEEPELNGLTPESAAREVRRRRESGELSDAAEDRLLEAVLKMQQGIQLTLDQLVRMRKESDPGNSENSQ